MTTNKFPFWIHGLAPQGVRVITSGQNYGAQGVTLRPGDVLEVTQEIRDLNANRFGESFLDLAPEEQVKLWGTQRFGRGTEIPKSVEEGNRARLIDQLQTEQKDILWSGGLRGDGVKAARLAAVRAALEELGVQS